MTRRILSLAICLLFALTTCLTGMADVNAATTITDMAGKEIVFGEPVTRLVALAASDCEILYAIGAGDMLAGRGEYCDYPAEIIDVPVVNSGAGTNLEQLIALDPDAVVMPYMSQRLEDVQALDAVGIPAVSTNAQDIAGVYTAIDLLGALTGQTAEAEALISDMRAVLDSIAAAAENTGKTVYFEVSPLEYGLWTAGSGTFMNELAEICGLTNAFADVEGWAEISEEQVIERNPDYIVTITMYISEEVTPVEEILSRPGWNELTAVRNGMVYNADSNAISRPGPRLAEAAQALHDFITGTVTAE